MMNQLRKMQQEMAKAQDEIPSTPVEGAAAAGAVKVTMSGDFRVTKIALDRSVVDPDDVETLEDVIVALKERVRVCSRCCAITEDDPCPTCSDVRRNATLICVVAEAKDVFAIERTSAYDGRYHVLGGLISPMDG